MDYCISSDWHSSPPDWCYCSDASCKNILHVRHKLTYEVSCFIAGIFQAVKETATAEKERELESLGKKSPKADN